MADPKFPYVKWRDGRPRSSHGAYARALGFVDGDLRHPPNDENGRPVGRWFNLQEASDFSDKRKSEIEAARRAGKLPKKITVRGPPSATASISRCSPGSAKQTV
ncbi:hypothetical protein IVB18_49295 (plasmid) [Bradyrhizobium sp. 186]|uniref:hypothetical protein n=1 Tax=Bradyrhizobium sp. 186 TaxID=2782654 RepID=UPI0020016816|nr:hypothetical protein [Bradyrhizobium sp. 186]UPK40929.1 hypothetical protein IVB18_49295 [Bradyrhizobium sp. 186]